MYLGTSLFLIAVGAILTFAVTTDTEGFNINNAGWILMGVGAVGLLLSLFLTQVWSGRRNPDDPPAGRY